MEILDLFIFSLSEAAGPPHLGESPSPNPTPPLPGPARRYSGGFVRGSTQADPGAGEGRGELGSLFCRVAGREDHRGQCVIGRA